MSSGAASIDNHYYSWPNIVGYSEEPRTQYLQNLEEIEYFLLHENLDKLINDIQIVNDKVKRGLSLESILGSETKVWAYNSCITLFYVVFLERKYMTFKHILLFDLTSKILYKSNIYCDDTFSSFTRMREYLDENQQDYLLCVYLTKREEYFKALNPHT